MVTLTPTQQPLQLIQAILLYMDLVFTNIRQTLMQQQQLSASAAQSMVGNQFKAAAAATKSDVKQTTSISNQPQITNWNNYNPFLQQQQQLQHKPQEYTNYQKQVNAKEESPGQSGVLPTSQAQPTYRAQPNNYQQPNNIKNGYIAGGDFNWGGQQATTMQQQPQIFTQQQQQQQQQRLQYQQQLQQYQTFQQQMAVNQRGVANPAEGSRAFGAKANSNYGTEGWGAQQGNPQQQMGNWNYGAQNNWGRDGGWGDWNGPRNSPRRAEDGPHIPPFPEAWQTDGVRPPQPGSMQEGSWDDRNRGSWGGGNNWQQQGYDQSGGNRITGNNTRYQRDEKGNNRYSPNSRQPRGGKTERELWSPADSKKMDIKLGQANEIKTFLYAWMGVRHLRPVYDVQSIGERPEQTFRCELRVNNYKFVGVGEAESKKEAQTEAAWNFADYLVKQGDLLAEELPPRTKFSEDSNPDIELEKEEEEEKPKEKYNKNLNQRPRRGNYGSNKSSLHHNNIPHMMGILNPPTMNMPPPHYLFERDMWPQPHPNHRGGPWMDGPPAWRGGGRNRGGRGWNSYQNEYWRRRDMEEQWMEEMHSEFQHPEDIFISRMIMNQQEATGYGGMIEGRQDWNYGPSRIRNTVTLDDRHVMAKHASIYPREEELRSVHQIVTIAERSLKALSDKFVDEDHPVEKTPEELEEEKEEEEEGGEKKGEDDDKMEKKAKIQILKRPKKRAKRVPDLRPRVLSAVNRVGPLAKGLLIHNDDTVDLVLLCGDIPNKDLLHRVMENLPEQIRKIDDTIKFELIEEEAGFKIVADFDVKVELSVTLTSTEITLKKELKPKEVETPASDKNDNEAEKEEESAIKEEKVSPEENAEDLSALGNLLLSSCLSDESHDEISGNLPKHLLLGALARLRHAKWFQARASQQDSCVVITRILRDLQKRDKVWGALSSWALENLVYIALSSSTEHMSPGDAFRRFFEVVSGGILLPDRPGLQDPCEKEPIDILDCCTDQQLDDVTKSAQNFLLKIAFREVHKVLGMDRVNSMHRHPNSFPHPHATTAEDEVAQQRKRRFEANTSDATAESPKRSLTDEEDTDTQQNLADLTISETEVCKENNPTSGPQEDKPGVEEPIEPESKLPDLETAPPEPEKDSQEEKKEAEEQKSGSEDTNNETVELCKEDDGKTDTTTANIEISTPTTMESQS
uniref:uncharacterized protein LOC100180184 isoform X2 n=2 Tax=Ciona intestinalis TaxID=7719 RepID=UPI000EF4608F|nr:uncharacterized protein LOC100180184 isoform X2 [Ciona intestinalis]|eukprot:XP_026692505.1 uncharacterized protein LOC100180184 isoform X2 [Ciona intestinalis]